jgi:hypothetical protein
MVKVRAICIATARHCMFSRQSSLSVPGRGAVQTYKAISPVINQDIKGTGTKHRVTDLMIDLVTPILTEDASSVDGSSAGMETCRAHIKLGFELYSEDLWDFVSIISKSGCHKIRDKKGTIVVNQVLQVPTERAS